MSHDTPLAPVNATPGYYRQIVGSLTSGVIAVDAHGVILTANAAAAASLALEPEAIAPGRSIGGIPALAVFSGMLDELSERGEPIHRREATLECGAETHIFGVTASLLEGPDPFNGVAFLFSDLTEIRRLERAAAINRQLAQIGELTAGVVHEFRNPLSVISGMAELLLRKLGGDPSLENKAKAIVRETDHLGRLVNQFLSFAKPIEVMRAHCALEEVVNRAIELCELMAVKANIHIETHFTPGMAAINADLGKLAQALANLLRNAIEIQQHTGGLIRVVVSQDAENTSFRVEDNGPGINLADGKDLFQPFVSMKEGGTGLGLSIVQRIMTAHGGRARYGNREEGGAYFELVVPNDL